MNLESITLDERSQLQKTMYCLIPFTSGVWSRQAYRHRTWTCGCPGAEGEQRGVPANQYEVSLGDDENVPKLIVMTLQYTANILKPTELYMLMDEL
jgi:hypothetical protein